MTLPSEIEAMRGWNYTRAVSDDCKNIKPSNSWKVIKSKEDAGVMRLVLKRRELILEYVIDGSSDFREHLYNIAKWKTIDNTHGNWKENALELTMEIRRRLINPFQIDRVYGYGASRGGILACIVAEELNKGCGIVPVVMTFGSPPGFNQDKMDELNTYKRYEHIAFRNAGDFVDNISLPSLFRIIMPKFYRRQKFYHYTTLIVNLPNARLKFDHLNYQVSIRKYYRELKYNQDLDSFLHKNSIRRIT